MLLLMVLILARELLLLLLDVLSLTVWLLLSDKAVALEVRVDLLLLLLLWKVVRRRIARERHKLMSVRRQSRTSEMKS